MPPSPSSSASTLPPQRPLPSTMEQSYVDRLFTPPLMTDSHPPPETLRVAERAGILKARLPWIDLIVRSFLAGVFLAVGAGFNIALVGGMPSMRANNPALATLLGGMVFPVGFVFIIFTGQELCTSNMFVMTYSLLRRHTTVYDLVRNWVVSYVMNMAGCLFYAGLFTYWAGAFSPTVQTWAATQAEDRVNVGWGFNVTRGIMCNWFVSLAFFFAAQGRENVSKIYGMWAAILPFVVMGYQHCIANFYMVPVGMFYGAKIGVGRFIWKSVIPVTLGNIIGGAFFGAFSLWVVYGRHEEPAKKTGREGEDKV